MKYGSPIIEKKEYVYIKRLLQIAQHDLLTAQALAHKKFKQLLEDAIIVDEEEMPLDMIRINSQLKLKSLSTASIMPLHMVIPQQEAINQQRISILSPLGVALFGHSQEDVIALNFAKDRIINYRIIEVKQTSPCVSLDPFI